MSYQTVSRVLNHHPGVSPATRERVAAAVEATRYVPNAAARALVRGRRAVIGVLAVGLPNFGPASITHALNTAALAADWEVVIFELDVGATRSIGSVLSAARMREVSVLVLIDPPEELDAAVRAAGGPLPVVVVGPRTGDNGSVAVDQETGARLAVEHLLDLGHRSVAHLAGPPEFLAAAQRERGWRAALAERSAAPARVVRGDWSAASGSGGGLELVDDPAVTAVFCANDQMALGLLQAYRSRGRSVPTDVSVVGFDDIPEAAYLEPALTTVNQDFGLLGREVLRQVQAIEADHIAEITPVLLQPRLVVRESTAPR